MKTAVKIFIGLLSTFLFIVLILLVTIKFELLNKSFLFDAFEKQNIYAQLPIIVSDFLSNNPDLPEQERMGYAEFAKNIPPQIIKPIIENNLTQILNFLNGSSKNIIFSFSIPGIGFQDSSGFHWSLSQIPDKNLRERINVLNGIDDAFIAAIFLISVILIGLFFLYGTLDTPARLSGGKAILLSAGIFVLIAGLISKVIFAVIGEELMAGQELSQKITGLLSASLLPDITNTWHIAGGILILLWLGITIRTRTA